MDDLSGQHSVVGARLARRLALALALGALTGATSAPVAAAVGPGAFSVRPATYNPADPATRAYFKQTVKPGGVFAGRVVVENAGRKPVDLRVYPVDGLTGTTSGAVYGNLEDLLTGAGHWLVPDVVAVTVAPRSRRLVGFRLEVPPGTHPGDQLAGLAFEDTHPARSGGHFAITEIFRSVVGVDIRVPGRAAPAAALSSLALQPLPGTHIASVVVGLSNRGRLMCKPSLTVALRGRGPVRTVTRQLDTILPGDSIPYPFPWPASLAPGDYHVSARATGCGPAVSRQATVHTGTRLTGVSAGTPPQPPVGKPVVPWWTLALVGIAGLLAGMGIAIVVHARRRKRASDQFAAAEGDLVPHPS